MSHYAGFGNKNSNWVQSLCEDQDGNICVGLGKGPVGMAVLNRKNNTIKTFRANPDNLATIASNIVNRMYAGANGGIWVGTIGKGLNHYDPKTDRFKRYDYYPNDTTALRSPHIGALYHDKTEPGVLWIGTRGMGLYKFNIKTERAKMFVSTSKRNKTALSHNTVIEIVKDYKNNWHVS